MNTNFYHAFTYTLFLTLISTIDLFGQPNVPYSFPADYITQFQDIFVDDADEGWVVGICGVIRKTTDGGQSWTTEPSPTSDDLESIACSPEGCDKALMTSQDAMYRLENNVWTDITFEGFQGFGQIHWLTAQIAIYEPGGEEIFRSADAGKTWSPVILPDNQQSNLAFYDEINGYFFIDSALYKTSDIWETIESVGYKHSTQVYDLTWLDEDNGWLFDRDQRFHKTTDGGNTWTLLNYDEQLNSVNWMVALSETHLVGAKVTTTRIESLDGGVTWNQSNFLVNGNQRVNEKFHRRGNEFFLVGNQSQLLYSVDGFTDFYELDPFDRQSQIGPIAFLDDNNGYALTSDGPIKTQNGGLTWEDMEISLFSIRDMGILDDGSLVLLASSGSMISTDNGVSFDSWIPDVVAPANERPTLFTKKPNGEIYLLSSNNGYLSIDDGKTFSVFNIGHAASLTDIFFLDANNGYACGRQKQFMYTTDGGQSWTQSIGPTNNFVDVFFLDEMNGWVSTGSRRYSTTDKGQTWSSSKDVGGYDMVKHPVNGSIISAEYGGGNVGNLMRSMDNGESWQQISGNCHSYRAGGLTPSGNYFFTGGDGFLVRHDLEALTTSTKRIVRKDIAKLFAYPNPVTDLVYVELPSNKSESFINMIDINGRLIYTIEVSAYQERAELTTSDLQSGIYIIQWYNDGQMGQTKIIKN